MNTGVFRSRCRGATALSHTCMLVLRPQNAFVCLFTSQSPGINTKFQSKSFGRLPPLWLKEKLGLGTAWRVSASVVRPGQDLSGSKYPEQAFVLEQFERNCAASTHVGIACYVDAISRDVKTLPFDSQDRMHIRSNGSVRAQRQWLGHILNSQTDGPDRTIIVLKPRTLKHLQCTMVERNPGQRAIPSCTLKIRALSKPESLLSTAPAQLEIKIQDELEYVSDIFDMVVKRFCAEMTFHGREEVASTLAEALLRVMQLRTPVLQVDSMILRIEFESQNDGSVVAYKSVATWKTASQDASSDQPGSREVEVIVEQLSKDVSESEQDEEPEKDDEGAEDPEPTIATEVEPPPSTDESITESSSILSLLKPTHEPTTLSLNSNKKKFRLVRPPSIDWNQRVGMPLEIVDYIWQRDQLAALETLSHAQLTTLFQTACSSAIGHGLSLACRVAGKIADETPGKPAVVLNFRVFDGNDADSKPHGIQPHPHELTVRANVRGKQPISIIFPGTPWNTSRSTELATQPQRLRMHYKFEIPRLHDSGGGGDDDVVVPVQRIKEIVEAHLVPHTELRAGESLLELVRRCGNEILQIQQPLAGLVYFSRVDVGLSVFDAHGRIIERASEFFDNASRQAHDDGDQNGVFIALGSNLGDRFAAIESACRRIDEDPDMQVVKTSELFETEPMYVEDQSRFLNGVCQINTSLEPVELLDRLQAIETDLGRVKIIDKGPRNIDLDIVAYGQRQLNTDRLVIPHRLMVEREFVLRPLSAIARGFVHPATQQRVQWHLERLPASATPMYPLTPLAPGLEPLHSFDPGQKTLIMSILNVTPDSFSDGGDNPPTDTEALKAIAASHIAAGASIIDIGGQSSRPNAPDVSAEEEIERILPAIKAIKSLPEASKVAISVDTYRASVAEAAIDAGAHIINDISAGLLDAEMLPTIARLGCTYIMMHMRGTPHTMQNEENISYPAGVTNTVATELAERLDAAQAAGIRRWRIILDPGVGFAKTTEQNVEILRKMNAIRGHRKLQYLPWLVGTSRKGFIGKITGVEKASERVAGTAATVTAAVAGGAGIVRVHDVEEMARVVKMADAIYRTPKRQDSLE